MICVSGKREYSSVYDIWLVSERVGCMVIRSHYNIYTRLALYSRRFGTRWRLVILYAKLALYSSRLVM